MDELKILGALHKRLGAMGEPGKDVLRHALATKGFAAVDAADILYIVDKLEKLSAEGKALAAKKINGSGATAPEGTGASGA